MLIACPQCSATYEVPEERVPAGREVRCARCITLWTPVPLVPASIEHGLDGWEAAARSEMPSEVVPDIRREIVDEPEPVVQVLQPPMPAGPDVVAPERSTGRGWGLLAGWGVTLGVLGVLVWLAVVRRADVMQAWPPSERAYVAVGLAPRR